MTIQEDVPLTALTTLQVGGVARYFAEIKREDDVREAVHHAAARGLPLFVLGGGSNPVTSIGPILAVPGIRDALVRARGKVAAISPIVGNAAVAGPAGILMTAQGLPCSKIGRASWRG